MTILPGENGIESGTVSLRQESCSSYTLPGWATPGQSSLLKDLINGQGRLEDLDTLEV